MPNQKKERTVVTRQLTNFLPQEIQLQKFKKINLALYECHENYKKEQTPKFKKCKCTSI